MHGSAPSSRPARDSRLRRPCKVVPRALALVGLCLALFAATTTRAQTYQVGDVVADFPLTQRNTGATETFNALSDFEGKIIFLEFFYYWCPYCQQAAIDIDRDIVKHYATQNGTPAGLEVVHIGVNLQAGADASTDAFIQNAGFHLVADDTTAAARNLFHTSGFPVFVIINGVKNSPSHQQWQVLYSENAYHSSADTIAFRQTIDAVQKPIAPASIGSLARQTGGAFEMRITGDVGQAYDIEYSADLKTWTFGEKIVVQAGGVLWSDSTSPGATARFYRVISSAIAAD